MLRDEVFIRTAIEAHSKSEIDLNKQLLFAWNKTRSWIMSGEL